MRRPIFWFLFDDILMILLKLAVVVLAWLLAGWVAATCYKPIMVFWRSL